MGMNEYGSNPEELEIALDILTEEAYASSAEMVKRAAKDLIDGHTAKMVAEAEAAIEDGEWVRLISRYGGQLPIQEVITIVTGMRNKGFNRDHVKKLLEAWAASERQKTVQAEKDLRHKKALETPKPEAFGLWA